MFQPRSSLCSPDEMQEVLDLGIDASRILYANPAKQPSQLRVKSVREFCVKGQPSRSKRKATEKQFEPKAVRKVRLHTSPKWRMDPCPGSESGERGTENISSDSMAPNDNFSVVTPTFGSWWDRNRKEKVRQPGAKPLLSVVGPFRPL